MSLSKSLKYFSNTSGIQYHEGPISNVKPFDENFLALPPSLEFFSSTYTLCPLLARYVADDNPENPLPITQIFFLVFI